MRNRTKVSVVIPTLGSGELMATIERINIGTIVPVEILICIPKQYTYKIKDLRIENVKVIPTSSKGQVGQRAVGFKAAASELVLQLDDDVLLDKFCLENLVVGLNSISSSAAVAPVLYDRITGACIFDRPSHSFYRKSYYWLLNGSEGYYPGRIYKSGSGDGVNPKFANNCYTEVNWVSGGCVLHRKSSLVTDDYYPFKGKALCEDLIHSFLLRRAGVQLFVISDSSAFTDNNSYVNQGVIEFSKWLIADFRARRYFLKLSSQKSLRVLIFYGFIILNYSLSLIRRAVR